MNRIQDRIVLVTGASSGIGAACARAFAAMGAHLVLGARRGDRLDALAAELTAAHPGLTVRTKVVDVRDRAAVEAWAEELRAAESMPDVLINNAGLSRGLDKIHEGDPSDWDEMVDTNVKGLMYVTRAFLPEMVRRNRGHVVNLGSIAGHMVYPGGNAYAATKYAVRALTEATSVDLVGTNVKVSSISPGMVAETEFSEVRFHGDTARAEAVYRDRRPLTGADIADAVCWMVNTPEHVNVLEIVIMPTEQRNVYVTRPRESA